MFILTIPIMCCKTTNQKSNLEHPILNLFREIGLNPISGNEYGVEFDKSLDDDEKQKVADHMEEDDDMNLWEGGLMVNCYLQ